MDNDPTAPTPEWIHQLASRLMDGGLTPSEERDLGVALQSSREARAIMRSYFRLEGALTELARASLLSDGESSGVRGLSSKRRRSAVRPLAPAAPESTRRWAWAGALLAAGALWGLVYLVSRPEQLSRGPSPEATALHLPSPPTSELSGPPPRPPGPGDLPTSPGLAERPAPPTPSTRPEAPPERSSLPTEPGPSETAPASAPAEPKAPPAEAEFVVTEVTVERVEGTVLLTGPAGSRSAKRGDRVPAGQGIDIGPDRALAVLTFPDGSRLEARPDTAIRNVRPGAAPGAPAGEGRGGKSLFLQRGSIWAHVRPQPADRPFVLGTPRGEAKVLGTILTLRVDPDPRGAVRLDVQEGKVRFTRPSDGRSIEVPTGHSVSSSPGSDLAVIRSMDLLASFQDGIAPSTDYAGTRDTYIAEKSPQTNFGHAKSLAAEYDDARGKHRAQWPLVRWDLSSVPAGSHVRSASISLYVTEPSHGYSYFLFEPARAWAETETTWKLAATGNPWRVPGSLGAIDRWGPPVGILAPLVKGEYTAVLNEAGIALVQSWVNAPASNLGFIIASPEPAAGLHFNSRKASIPETRPKLTIVYTPRR